jgi:PleD family two-component response regulator
MLASAHAQSTESKFRLLYLGSDLALIAALRKVLTEPDYRLVACSDRGSAVMFLKSEIPYDLLLIDLEWRGREGLKLAQLTGSLTQRKRMPIILVGVELSKHTMKLASRAGVNKCVTKTPDMGAVSEMIRQMIEGVKR